MTIPKKGRRIVRVGDAEYAWRIRRKPTYLQGALQTPMTLAVQPCDLDARSVLVVSLSVSRPDNWISPHQTAVKPAMVREMISGAIASGWQPHGETSPFFYEYPLIRDRS
jgi:hypothetical protein